MFDFQVKSHKGPYAVRFLSGGTKEFLKAHVAKSFFVVDSKVMALYGELLEPLLSQSLGVLQVDAIEPNKDARRALDLAEQLMNRGLRRSHQLVAVGGGITQDITCFLASTLLRGVPWVFIPTTLLAQCDSCIGSKSSINLGKFKNILGTFLPPNEVLIDTDFLRTLTHSELCSGVGEMLKVHALSSDKDFFELASEYDDLFSKTDLMMKRIFRSLEIKKTFIEVDEFDQGVRNLLNYGHSFGHAVESATDFAIPHGVAVSVGLDMANFVSERLGFSEDGFYAKAHPTLRTNYKDFLEIDISLDKVVSAIAKDKKNTASGLVLILRDTNGKFSKTDVKADARFTDVMREYLGSVWNA